MEGLIRACHESPQQQDKGLNLSQGSQWHGGQGDGICSIHWTEAEGWQPDWTDGDWDVQSAVVWWAPWFVFSRMLS